VRQCLKKMEIMCQFMQRLHEKPIVRSVSTCIPNACLGSTYLTTKQCSQRRSLVKEDFASMLIMVMPSYISELHKAKVVIDHITQKVQERRVMLKTLKRQGRHARIRKSVRPFL
jgi:hypothetical protein